MTNAPYISPHRTSPRIRPLKAWRHMQNLLADKEDTEQVFHILEALNGGAIMRALKEFAATDKGQARLKDRLYLPDILDDHDTLWKLPANSVGRAYVEFMEKEGLTAHGLVAESDKWRQNFDPIDDDLEFFSTRMRDTHDLFHVLTGYGRDQLGETSLLAFTYGQERSPGALFIAWVGTRDLVKMSPREANVMAVMWEGKRHGHQAKLIVSESIPALLKEPLTEARQRLGIAEPVKYKRALAVLNNAGYEGRLSAA